MTRFILWHEVHPSYRFTKNELSFMLTGRSWIKICLCCVCYYRNQASWRETTFVYRYRRFPFHRFGWSRTLKYKLFKIYFLENLILIVSFSDFSNESVLINRDCSLPPSWFLSWLANQPLIDRNFWWLVRWSMTVLIGGCQCVTILLK